MLRNDDLDTVDFTVPYLQDATLLLTIPQVERLISSGKTIPQNVRIKLENVGELTADRARELTKAFTQKDFGEFETKNLQNLCFTTFTEYDAEFKNINISRFIYIFKLY